MGCGCKNKGNDKNTNSVKTQSAQTQSVTEAVKKVVEKYYIKK